MVLVPNSTRPLKKSECKYSHQWKALWTRKMASRPIMMFSTQTGGRGTTAGSEPGAWGPGWGPEGRWTDRQRPLKQPRHWHRQQNVSGGPWEHETSQSRRVNWTSKTPWGDKKGQGPFILNLVIQLKHQVLSGTMPHLCTKSLDYTNHGLKVSSGWPLLSMALRKHNGDLEMAPLLLFSSPLLRSNTVAMRASCFRTI